MDFAVEGYVITGKIILYSFTTDPTIDVGTPKPAATE
jgi:hypothetical protein